MTYFSLCLSLFFIILHTSHISYASDPFFIGNRPHSNRLPSEVTLHIETTTDYTSVRVVFFSNHNKEKGMQEYDTTVGLYQEDASRNLFVGNVKLPFGCALDRLVFNKPVHYERNGLMCYGSNTRHFERKVPLPLQKDTIALEINDNLNITEIQTTPTPEYYT